MLSRETPVAIILREYPVHRPAGPELSLTLHRCRCGAEFCYLCGAKWQTCPDTYFNEERLYARAVQYVARHPNNNIHHEPQGDEDGNNLDPIIAAVEHLRASYDCRHMRWRQKSNVRPCELCGQNAREFLLECRRCRLQVCRPCRRHRL